MTDRNTANLLSRIDLLMREVAKLLSKVDLLTRANDQQAQTIDRLRDELAKAKRGK